MSYHWDLIEFLLHEIQHPTDEHFKPRLGAEKYAQQLEGAGQPLPNMDRLRAEAAEYESLLLDGGFIEPLPEEAGGTGENYRVTERGSRLLSLIGDSYPNHAGVRQSLDDRGDAALTPEVFDDLAARAAART